MLNPDFRDILSIFTEEKFEFLVVGAYALAAHGLPRATGDIDLWVRNSSKNADRVLKALENFGAPIFDLNKNDLQSPNIVFQIGVAPRRIDIFTTIDGVEFEIAWQSRLEVEMEGLKIPVINREHLLQNKKASGRPKDKADVLLLENSKG